MKRKLCFSVLFSILMATGAFAQAKTEELAQLDQLIAKNQLAKALAAVENALKQKSNNSALLVRKSRIVALQGDQKKDEDEKVAAYEQAKQIANLVIESSPELPNGHLRRAVAKGKLILFKGILESRTLVLELREDAQKAIELAKEGTYEKALGYYLLGRAHLKLAEKPRVLRVPVGLGWASDKQGGEFLKKAATIYPSSIAFNLDYALWLKEKNKTQAAKKHFEKIANLEVYDPADPEHKKRAAQELANL